MLVASLLGEIGRGLREGFFMFWETLWPLVLGFGLSGVVQAFVSHEQMEKSLGTHRPSAVGRASVFGMVSSSCSYAASAMAKSLFQKGADFISAMVFMFASTNLVIELGIVLVILMGWQFMAAEFIGGPIMIVLLATLGSFVIGPALIDQARRKLARNTQERDLASPRGDDQARLENQPWSQKVRSLGAWADAASYAIADLKMLRREMAIGYVVAGFLAVLVPGDVWNAVFLHGHGFWTILENAIVGPLIAFASFVCSIGNVPLAAALWKGGISFGGVVSFIFADLIAAPLVLIYRRYYGLRLTLRLVLLFWAVMAAAGLIVEGIFSVTKIIPTTRSSTIVAASFHWNYTAVLNVVFLLVFAVLYYLYRHRERFGGGSGYALDPVCGMQVRTTDAPAVVRHFGRRVYFCSDHCAERFSASPERFSRAADVDQSDGTDHLQPMEDAMAIDPVCGMHVDPATAAAIRSHDGRNYFFCALGCAEAFDNDPERYAPSTSATES